MGEEEFGIDAFLRVLPTVLYCCHHRGLLSWTEETQHADLPIGSRVLLPRPREGELIEVVVGVEGGEGEVALEGEFDELLGLLADFQQSVCEIVSFEGLLGLLTI